MEATTEAPTPNISPTRKGQGGTHQYHAVGSHIFLVADVHPTHLAEISFTSPPVPGIFYPTEYFVSETDRPGTEHRS